MIIPPSWSLPDAIRIRLGQSTYGRQRAIFELGHLLLVLHQPPGPDDVTRDGILFWRNDRGEWQCSRSGPGPGALKRHVQSYVEHESKLAQDFEKATDSGALFDLLESLTPLSRAARNMHAALQKARESVQGDTFLIEMRDLASDVERNLELLIEDVRLAIQHRTAREAEERARLGREALQASHRLNMLAALFFPMTAIASIFGMNLFHGLDTHDPKMFIIVLAVGVCFGLAMRGWVMAKPKATLPAKAKGS